MKKNYSNAFNAFLYFSHFPVAPFLRVPFVHLERGILHSVCRYCVTILIN